MNSLKPYKLLYSAREDVVDEEFFGFVYLFDKNKLLASVEINLGIIKVWRRF